ncbi:MAG TPA: hypothetical protein VGI86_01640 [Acidimicrobiia bacterium]|jgi:predicted transcriptional regulator
MTNGDQAQLSSIQSQLDELQRRITAIADEYATTPDSQIAAELFSSERSLRTAARAIERAAELMRR